MRSILFLLCYVQLGWHFIQKNKQPFDMGYTENSSLLYELLYFKGFNLET